jgi:L-ascorbate metabolism protein UlaG (beta-lactamase superfamily)
MALLPPVIPARLRNDPMPPKPFPPVLLALATSLLMVACGTSNPYYDPAKAHHTPDGFRNLADGDKPTFGALMRWRWQRLWREPSPQDASRVPRVALDPAVLLRPEAGWRATWIGHSTVLLQINQVNVITDPIFSTCASPFSWTGPERAVPPALTVADLPHIDAVLISHNHYDHLDEASVLALAGQAGGPPRFVVPLGMERWFADHGISSVQALDWWQETTVTRDGTTVRIELLPPQHWSRRGPWDTNANLWGSFGLWGGGGAAFFAGDTGYGPVFQEIGRRAGPFDLALIPVGCFEPRWFMHGQHVNPEEAVRIHRDVGARYSIGIHWGAFRMCDEPVEAPLDDLAPALVRQGVAADAFQLWAVGERRRIDLGQRP